MASTALVYSTKLPEDIVKIIDEDITNNYAPSITFQESAIGDQKPIKNKKIRSSSNIWITDQHWLVGFIWHYVTMANRSNFLFDLDHLDSGYIQYTSYKEGDHYTWHRDTYYPAYHKPVASRSSNNVEGLTTDYINKNIEKVRKLSFSLQLSSHDEYEGGNLQLIDDVNKSFISPRERGSLTIFDSRVNHRVTKVRSGERKSIVGWVMGPRWR
jgi:PKHD-type hydroxylase